MVRSWSMKLPGGQDAIVDQRKLTEYCLSREHPRGKHKARVFARVLGINSDDAGELEAALLHAAVAAAAQPAASDQFGTRYVVDFQKLLREVSLAMDRNPQLLDVVALLADLPEHGLVRGQVGTIVELFDGAFEVEFCDDEGRTYAELALKPDQLLVLHHRPQQAA